MNTSRSRTLITLAAVLGIALVAAWLLMPNVSTDPPVQAAAPVPVAPLGELPVAELAEVPSAPPGEAEVVIFDDPEPPPTTKTCETIAGWAQRGVPHYTLLDNIRDQSFRFSEEDLACLTAARDVPPIVLRFAEMYQDRNR